MDQVKVQFRTPEEVMDFTNVVSRYEYWLSDWKMFWSCVFILMRIVMRS